MMSVASAGLRQQLHSSLRTLNGALLERSYALHRPGIRLQMTCIRQNSEQLSPNLTVVVASQGNKFMKNRLAVCTRELFRSGPWKGVSTFSTRAFDNGATDAPSDDVQFNGSKKGGSSFFAKLLRNLVKALGVILLSAVLVAAALPSFLSWSGGRNAAISLANKSIPGTVSVSSMSLGWTQPVHVEGFLLQGPDSENVLSIPQIQTKAPLWSIVLGKSGLGDCTITSPVIDLQQHPKNNLPCIALALIPAEKLLKKSPATKKQQKPVVVPPASVSLSVQANAPNGGLKVTDGKVTIPSDVAAVLGDRLFLTASMGPWATKDSSELKLAEDNNEGVPLLASLWSDSVQFEAVGFLQKSQKLKLIKPLKAEMDLTPKVAKFYLARINPLLGEIVGPAIQDEDMPDVIVNVSPTNLELPADHYKVNIAPMKVTLARGQVVDGILSLLLKQDLVKGRRNLTMQTSAIEAKLDMPNSVESSRLDILIADRVHVATWGSLGLIDENVQMTLAIPGPTLRDLLGLTKVPASYYLKIPVGGTLDKPQVDWRTAGAGIAELTARQRGGQFVQSLLDTFHSNEKSKKSDTPEPIDGLPWAP